MKRTAYVFIPTKEVLLEQLPRFIRCHVCVEESRQQLLVAGVAELNGLQKIIQKTGTDLPVFKRV